MVGNPAHVPPKNGCEVQNIDRNRPAQGEVTGHFCGGLEADEQVVLANAVIPANSLVLGSPAKRVREVSPEHRKWIEHSWQTYVQLGREHSQGA